MKKIFLTNTISRKQEEFRPTHSGQVNMYVCGITPYDYAHLGHGRCYVFFDTLYRFLKYLGYKVKYVRNFTDIDDKLINRAQDRFGDMMRYKELTEVFISAYHENMKALNCLSPDVEPKVTENIFEIIEIIKKLIDKKYAYVSDGDVYFDTTQFKEYGKLSGRSIEEMIMGARVEISEKKKHPADFALWKSSEHKTFWESPWGYGRPGWHIECSALSQKYLGVPTIDIHGGGMDLIFPHHENEIAQSESANGCTFSKFWLHNAFVNVGKEKMSKSLGNFFTLNDIFKQIDPMSLRFFFLQHNYTTPIDFSATNLLAAQKAYKKLVTIFSDVTGDAKPSTESTRIIEEITDVLCNDLNTSRALGIIFENLAVLSDHSVTINVKNFLTNVLGLTFEKIAQNEIELTPEIETLIAQRERARLDKNWKLADELRDRLKDLGYEVKDKRV